jgi:hypothetical protein
VNASAEPVSRWLWLLTLIHATTTYRHCALQAPASGQARQCILPDRLLTHPLTAHLLCCWPSPAAAAPGTAGWCGPAGLPVKVQP